ncbi:MAG: glycosyltransferase family 2 protein [Dehalococcoidales bacterium]|nr:glycosyltransferase family 2 protein [Dehalococcoidales bacterium]
MMLKSNPLVSIVITSYTFERLNDVFKLLDGIKSQTYKDFEVIIVVESSNQLLEEIKAHIKKIGLENTRLILNSGERGASVSRNIGVKEARGDVIAFIDDDAIPFPDWLEKIAGSFTNGRIVGVTGPALPRWEDEKDAWFPKELHWILSCTSWFENDRIVEVRHAWLENAAFRKKAFDIAGYLDATIGPQDSTKGFKGNELQQVPIAEDLEVSLRIKEKTGGIIIYNPDVKVWHKAAKQRMTVSYIKKWSYWTGVSKKTLKKLYPDQESNILGPESQLLKRIITRLFPDIIKTVFTHPVIGFKKLRVTVIALFYVAIGYLLPARKQKT